MTDEAPSGEELRGMRAVDPSEVEPPGGCACGVVGCMTLMVALCAVLLAVVIYMALARPGLTPGAP
ncbi:MAG TPA: hypothetical protein VHG28_22500 [Longimicrobiaceae bacterium]|nr:hypothetical protein [Longimicrobiaceae bacterium]